MLEITCSHISSDIKLNGGYQFYTLCQKILIFIIIIDFTKHVCT